MADLVSDGKIRVIWAPSVANIAAPTVAEANAGLRLDTVMTPAGLKVAPTTGSVDTSALSSTYTTNKAGRRSFANSVEIKRQDSADTALTTLVYRADGFLLVRRTVDAATAPTIGQVWEVYPSECDEGAGSYGPNLVQTRVIGLSTTSDPNTAAVMA
jgi:hypothetical protein